MKNKTIGIVGCGAIGRLIAKKLQSFEVKKILGYDPFLDAEELKVYNIQKVDLKTVIKQSDLITLHIPLLPETKYMISLSELQQMRSSCCLINTSRGGIVKETDLIKALQKKIIHGAAADVFENEPEINKSLLKLPNFIATPHIAGYTEESDIEMSMMTVNKFLQIINGH